MLSLETLIRAGGVLQFSLLIASSLIPSVG